MEAHPQRSKSLNPVTHLGQPLRILLQEVGAVTLFLCKTLRAMLHPRFYMRLFLAQLVRVGFFSLPVVALTTFFTGGVLVLQIYASGNHQNPVSIIANIVALGITRELSPALTGLMVAGRVGAAIAAELGSMRTSSQIDALVTLRADPFQYLVVPRFCAAVLALPLLVFVGDIVGILGGLAAATSVIHVSASVYMQETIDFLHGNDITSGLWKAVAFGAILSLISAYFGFKSQGGAQGVGRAATNAVVVSSILILTANYLLTSLVFT